MEINRTRDEWRDEYADALAAVAYYLKRIETGAGAMGSVLMATRRLTESAARAEYAGRMVFGTMDTMSPAAREMAENAIGAIVRAQ